MLSFEIKPDGGVLIAGTAEEFEDLRDWLREAQVEGYADPSYVADRGLTTIEIVRREPQP